MALTGKDIAEIYRDNGKKVRGPLPSVRSGQAGTYYVLTRKPSDGELAAITHTSGNREVSLIQIDRVYVLYVGGGLSMTMGIPPLGNGIKNVVWIAHTHPLERESKYEGVARGATPADRETLEHLFHMHGGTKSVESRVLLVKGGKVVKTVPFFHDAPLSIDSIAIPPK